MPTNHFKPLKADSEGSSTDNNFTDVSQPARVTSSIPSTDIEACASPARIKKRRRPSTPSSPALSQPDLSPSSPPSTVALDKLRQFFAFRHDDLKPSAGHTKSINTRSPGSYDRHLAQEYRLKHVVKLETIPDDLASVAQKALEDFEGDLPPVAGSAFPTCGMLKQQRKANKDHIQTEADVERIYRETVGKACATVAGTLAYGHASWSSGCLQWSFQPQDTRRSPVAKNQAAADGFLNIADTGPPYILSKTQREILRSFPVLAIWEFKNLNFCRDPSALATVQGAVDSFLDGLFPWATCQFGEQCVAKHPKASITGSLMGWDADKHPCACYQQAIKTTAYRTKLKQCISTAKREEIRRKKVEKIAGKKVASRTKVRSKMGRKSLDHEEEDEGSEPNTGTGSETEVDTTADLDVDTETEAEELDDNTVGTHMESDLKPVVQFKESSRDLVQQVWSEAVRHDATFAVIHTGNTEVFCIRDRLTQTLYVSDVIKISDRMDYMQIHTGLMIAAIQDAEDRERLLRKRPTPNTWSLPPGTENANVLNLKHKANPKDAQKELLKEAKNRLWLKFNLGDGIGYVPFNKGLYHRLDAASLERLSMPGTREPSLGPSEAELSSQTSRGSSMSLDISLSQGGQDFLSLTQAMFESPQYSIADHEQETPLDLNTFYQLHVQEGPFHGQNICRGMLRIHGTLFHKSFKAQDHPVLVIKSASEVRTIQLLKHEYQVLQKLNEALVPGVPQAYGFYYHPNKDDSRKSFAALVMEDRGISLYAYERAVKQAETRRAASLGVPEKKRRKIKHGRPCIATVKQQKRFHLILDRLHTAGYAHGALTTNSLMFRDGSKTLSTDVSILGFKHARRLELDAPNSKDVIMQEKKKLTQLLSNATMPESYYKARLEKSVSKLKIKKPTMAQ
ncbi:hypothetical protein H0H87_005970 [Tephrocybe sp. NHM501043]|nr:hypothetical protein H0H87_005970 [Tephrocybe sp. NHM501043]